MNGFPAITILTALPLVGGLAVMSVRTDRACLARRLALAVAFACLALALILTSRFDSASGELQFQEQYSWIDILGITYHVGADGLSLLLLLLTAIVVPMAMLASGQITRNAPLYYGLVLLLETGLFGTFTALNFFHWFLFWELSLVPAFFLIKLWGGPGCSFAATQFFVYTMVGSVALLLAFLALFWSTRTFEFTVLAEMGRNGTLAASLDTLGWTSLTTRGLTLAVFLGAFLGFAVKVPLIPFHTWLPSAYAEAPTATTMLLTGLMSKMGVYGFLRILLPIFPHEMARLLTPLLWLTVASIVCSAGAAFAQRDLKRLLAYSSINHLGYCLLGTLAILGHGNLSSTPQLERTAALNGAFLQIFNHGLTAATLFWFVGILEQRSGGLRGLNDFGGLRRVTPILCGLMGIALFSSLGLPGLNGFVGEFLIFKGAFPLVTWAAALSIPGLLLTAVFLLTLLQRVFYGPLNPRWSALPDLNWTERAMVFAPITLLFLLGIYPQLLLGRINSTTVHLINQLGL